MIDAKQLKFEIRTNPLFRFFTYPIGTWKRKKALNEYYASGEILKLLDYKNIHRGERCFIIGNGPSLTIHDLELLSNEITFAANGIFRMFEDTQWRPTYYIVSDSDVAATNIEGISKVKCRQKFIEMRSMAYRDQIKECVFICTDPTFIVNIYNINPHIQEDITKYLSNGGSVMFTIIQLALYMGFTEMYLIGQDFSMPYYKDRFGLPHKTETTVTHAGKINAPFKRIYLYRDTMLNAFTTSRQYCEAHGVKIINASRGGKLEVFEREKLESVLKHV